MLFRLDDVDGSVNAHLEPRSPGISFPRQALMPSEVFFTMILEPFVDLLEPGQTTHQTHGHPFPLLR